MYFQQQFGLIFKYLSRFIYWEAIVSTTVCDVAKYILEKQGACTAMKLQKLTFYAKAWCLVWDEEELFPEEFEAWANGAVSPVLYAKHRGMFKVSAEMFPDSNSVNIDPEHKNTINKVLEFYGSYTAQQLSDINHQEPPWNDARGDIPALARCSTVISSAAIAEYYSGIWNDEGDE
jgi:uncharacterized phage-associated protein